MIHLAAYTAAAAAVASNPNAMTGLVDPVLTRSATSSLYILPQRMQLLAAVAMSTTIARLRVNSPTLRQITSPYIRPIILSARPTSNAQVAWYGDQPLMLPALEELQPTIDITAAGPEVSWFLLWLADQVVPIPQGPIIKCRLTSVTAAGVGIWTLLATTFETSLPSGLYAIVGSEHISTTAVAHRFAIPNQLLRPGSMSHQANGDIQDMRLMTRRLGTYGTFLNTAPPQVEVLCTAADASHEIYMDVIPLSGQIAA